MLVNMNQMLKKAKEEHYAVPHFNINNLEWTKFILEECNELNVPVILGVSEGAVKYMGSYLVVADLVKALVKSLNIKIPVCLHLDHGSSLESCISAIDAGFSSVMIDGSRLPLKENIKITKEVVSYAHERGISVEAEVGHIGTTEDNMTKEETNATLEDCQILYENTNIDALAAALGSVHGFYKKEANLDFETMELINKSLPVPLVLHGGTGIPDDKIRMAISKGISKININTELQSVWSKAVRKYLLENEDVYDPRKIISSGEAAMKERISEIVTLFGTKI
ncbi:MAG: class II fructose-1,6-bisphosphate aldolase [Tenericutes bacterium]|nr:class II fructose-1,6-bisphosphate aldolase [Mycoplasmatota bacterium]MDD6941770.1 class II fructose-1,6-bisphosphate aldolase [bacterium]MDY5992859.1 class II fructose-1,6-bisphosphate aldolase [Bacilli bacterium]